jgi:xylulokinase
MTARTDGAVVLAVDLGTGGPKVGLVDLGGRIRWSTHVPLATTFGEDGAATQDAAQWWDVILAAGRDALSSGAARPEEVVAVSCTGQWASTVPVDDEGEPVGPCVMWMDTRGGPHSRAAVGGPFLGYGLRAAWRFVRRSGGAPSVSGADPVGHILFLEHEQPEVARAARYYMEPVDYLSFRFSGVAAASHASMTAAWLTDNRHLDRLAYDPVLVATAGVPAGKLPPLVPSASVVGTVRAEVAQALGLPPGARVVAGTPDLHSAAAGAGALGDFEAHLALSTTSWISCPVPFKKTDPVHQVASVPGVPPGRYIVADNHETAGACLQWLRDEVLYPARRPPRPSFDELVALAADVSPGAGGVIFTPWLAGQRSPVEDHDARGGFHNLSLMAGEAELVRAVLEGVAFQNRWLLGAVERFVGRRLDPLRLIGGGAQSALWCQVHADVLGRRVEQVAEPLHANLRGAALLAGVALGLLDREAVRATVPVAASYAVDPVAGAAYERLFAEFPGLYRAQRGMFRRLNRRRPARDRGRV